jgi:hypothetical protein
MAHFLHTKAIMESLRGTITRILPERYGSKWFEFKAEKSADLETSEKLLTCIVTMVYEGEIPEPGSTVTLLGVRLSTSEFSVHQISAG